MPACLRRLFSMRSMLRMAAGFVILYSAAILVLIYFEDRMVFHPVPASLRWGEPPAGFEMHDVYLQTADGTSIHARWFPCPQARGDVLICHSQSGNLSTELGPRSLTSWHKDIGISALIFDYPGYGRSGGTPSEAGCYAAA